MPSVLAAEVPVVTLSVDNIQVRAEWDVVGDDANYFSVEGGTLMLQPVTWTGYPERRSNTITAIVEVRDKFSTLNPNYEDLITRIKITTVIMGCYAYWTGRFAKSFRQERKNPPNQIIMEYGPIKSGDVIARTDNNGGFFLHTVTITETQIATDGGITYKRSYMTTSPDLFEYLNWDSGKAAIYLGWTELEVNESETCFAEEIETFQERQNTEYLNANAPLVSGVYAGSGIPARIVTISDAFALSVSQHFYLYDVKLGGLLPRPNFIIDNGKAFRIDNSYPIDNSRYEYVANLNVASDGHWNNDPHEVIFLYQDCPTVYNVSTNVYDGIIYAGPSDAGKIKAFARIQEKVYKVSSGTIIGPDHYRIDIEGLDTSSLGHGQIDFADHFLCQGYL